MNRQRLARAASKLVGAMAEYMDHRNHDQFNVSRMNLENMVVETLEAAFPTDEEKAAPPDNGPGPAWAQAIVRDAIKSCENCEPYCRVPTLARLLAKTRDDALREAAYAGRDEARASSVERTLRGNEASAFADGRQAAHEAILALLGKPPS